MALLADLVLQSANNPGTGTFQLIAPPVGRRSFIAAFGTAKQAYYVANDGTQWEEGYGTLTAGSPDTLTRDAVLDNSAGGTAPVSFTGTVQVYCDVPASRLLIADTSAVWQGQGRRMTGLAAATVPADAPNLGQVGWSQIGAGVTLAAGSGGAIFTLPPAFNRFRAEFEDCAPTAAAQMFFRVSLDGGNTYEQGGTEYTGSILQGLNNSATSAATANTFAALTGSTGGAVYGDIEIQADGNHEWLGRSFFPIGGGLALWQMGGAVGCSGVMTNLLIGAVGTSMAAGRMRLLGAKF